MWLLMHTKSSWIRAMQGALRVCGQLLSLSGQRLGCDCLAQAKLWQSLELISGPARGFFRVGVLGICGYESVPLYLS